MAETLDIIVGIALNVFDVLVTRPCNTVQYYFLTVLLFFFLKKKKRMCREGASYSREYRRLISSVVDIIQLRLAQLHQRMIISSILVWATMFYLLFATAVCLIVFFRSAEGRSYEFEQDGENLVLAEYYTNLDDVYNDMFIELDGPEQHVNYLSNDPHDNGLWIRDLTQEGVEPNPGWISIQQALIFILFWNVWVNFCLTSMLIACVYACCCFSSYALALCRMHPVGIFFVTLPVYCGGMFVIWFWFYIQIIMHNVNLQLAQQTHCCSMIPFDNLKAMSSDDPIDHLYNLTACGLGVVQGWIPDLTTQGIEPNPGWKSKGAKDKKMSKAKVRTLFLRARRAVDLSKQEFNQKKKKNIFRNQAPKMPKSSDVIAITVASKIDVKISYAQSVTIDAAKQSQLLRPVYAKPKFSSFRARLLAKIGPKLDKIIMSTPKIITKRNELLERRAMRRCDRKLVFRTAEEEAQDLLRRIRYSNDGEINLQMFSNLIPSLTHRVDDKTRDFLSSFMSSVTDKPIRVEVEHSAPFLETMMTKLKEISSDPTVQRIILVLSAAVAAYVFKVVAPHVFTSICDLCSLLTRLYAGDDLVQPLTDVFDVISEEVLQKDALVTELQADKMTFVDIFAKLFMTAIAVKSANCFTTHKVADVIKSAPSLMRGMTFTVDSIYEIFRSVCLYFSGAERPDPYPEVTESFKELEVFIEAFDKDRNMTIERYQFLSHKLLYLQRILIRIPDNEKNTNYRSNLSYVITQYKAYVTMFKQQGVDAAASRCIAYAVGFIGMPGVGKTTISDVGMYQSIIEVAPPERLDSLIKDPESEVHRMFSEQKFMGTNFTGQVAFCFDDFMQTPGVPGTASPELMAFLRVMGSTKYTLDAADVESKGRHLATPALVVVNSNVTQFKDKSIESPEAIVRRFDRIVAVIPKLEWTSKATMTQNILDRRLDKERVRADSGDDKYSPKYVDVIDWDWLAGKPAHGAEFIDGAKFLEILRLDVIRHRRESEAARTAKISMVQRMVENRRARLQSGETFFVDILQTFFPRVNRDDLESVLKTVPDMDLSVEEFHAYAPEERSEYLLSMNKLIDEVVIVQKSELLRSGLTMWRDLSKYTAIVLSLGLAGAAVYYGYKFFFHKQVVELQSGDLQEKLSKRQLKRRRQLVSKLKGKEFDIVRGEGEIEVAAQLQGNIFSTNVEDVILSIFSHNVFEVTMPGLDKRLGMVLFFSGFNFVMLHHFFDKGKEMYDQVGATQQIVFTPKSAPLQHNSMYFGDIMWADELDGVSTGELVFGRVPPTFPPVHSMVHHIPFSDDNPFTDTKKLHCALWKSSHNGPFGSNVVAYRNTACVRASYLELTDCISYDTINAVGDCGSLLFATDKRYSMSLIGMHVAGNGKLGHSVALHRDDMMSFMKIRGKWSRIEPPSSTKISPLPTVLQSCDIARARVVVPEHFSVEGMTNKYRVGTDVGIVPSEIAGRLAAPRKFPVDLKADGILVKLRNKYGLNGAAINIALMEEAATQTLKSMMSNSDKDPVNDLGTMTFKEVIRGAYGLPGVNRKSSMGPPYMLERSNGKKDFFGSEGDYKFDTPAGIRLLEDLEADDEHLRSMGVVPEVLALDTMKAETRPLGKDPRMFFNNSFRNNALYARYYNKIIAHIRKNRNRNGVALGTNPFSSEEWSVIRRGLDAHLYKGDGDFKNYDGTLPYLVIILAHTVMCRMTGPMSSEENQIRMILADAAASALHIAVGDAASYVYKGANGHISGYPGTTPVNSIANCITHRYCFYAVLLGDAMAYPAKTLNFAEIEDHLYIDTFGDDIVWSHDYEQITMPALTAEFAKIGMTYTDSTKIANDRLYTERTEDLTFLQRAFNKINGRDVATLKLEIILEALNWKRVNAPEGSFEMTLEWALRELSYHGRDVFEEYYQSIADLALLEFDYVPEFTHWEHYFEKAQSSDYFY
jgi:hypothetical protein